MPYLDVSLPLKLKTLTYQYEEERDLTGFIVKVPLKNKMVEGIVINRNDSSLEELPPQIRKIDSIIGKAYNNEFIEFLKWMSFYYISEIGSVLRMTFFKEIVHILKGKKIKDIQEYSFKFKSFEMQTANLNEQTLRKIVDSVILKKYKTLLIHCPALAYEFSLMKESAKKVLDMGITSLLIVPEIKDAEALYYFIKKDTGNNVVLLHSEMKNSEILFSIKKILNEEPKIIVGTRFAIFAPIKNLSLIMLAQEQSWVYKEEQTPRYHTRDCAVMRGFIENCPVVLTSFMPSTNSYYNAVNGKYELIDDFNFLRHPEIKILRQPRNAVFHPEALLYLKLNLKDGIIITTPKTGYSMLRCSECGEIIKCKKCGYSMIFHKSEGTVECFRCGTVIPAHTNCPSCAGFNIHPIGTGIEKIKEELKNIFAKKDIEIKDFPTQSQEYEGIFVAQTGKIKKSYLPVFKGAIILEFDFFLSIPDFRAAENAFSKIVSISQMIKDNGTLFIQTTNAGEDIFKFIRSYSFKEFYHYELKHRKEVGFPPFVRLIKIIIEPRKKFKPDDLNHLKVLLMNQISGNVIGPHKVDESFVFILRSSEKRKLTETTKNAIQELKKIKSISFKVEVDPVSLKL